MSKLQITEDFILEVFKLCLSSRDTFLIIKEHLKSKFIVYEKHKYIWDYIVEHEQDFNKMPKKTNLKMQFRNDSEICSIIDDIFDMIDLDTNDVMIIFENFIRECNFVEMQEKMVDLYNSGKKEQSYELLKTTNEFLNNLSFKEEKFNLLYRDYQKRQQQRSSGTFLKEKIPTGILQLDDIMHGGVELGEIFLMLGESGVGKSQFLIFWGYSATKIGHKVAHFSAEGSKIQVENRYDACWSNSVFNDIKYGNLSEEQILRISKLNEKMLANGGEVFIDTYEKMEKRATIPDIRKSIHAMNKYLDKYNKGGRIKLVLVDYLELFSPGDGINYSPKEERFRQSKVSNQFKDIALEFDCALGCVTQSNNINNNDKQNEDFVLTRENLAEDKGKIRPFDAFCTINQTDEEKEEGILRIYFDKYRDGECKKTIRIVSDMKKTKFYDHRKTMELINSRLSKKENKFNSLEEDNYID